MRPGYSKSQRKNISFSALQLPLSALLTPNSLKEGLVCLFSNCISILSDAGFEGKESLLLPAVMSGTLTHLLTYRIKQLSQNDFPDSCS